MILWTSNGQSCISPSIPLRPPVLSSIIGSRNRWSNAGLALPVAAVPAIKSMTGRDRMTDLKDDDEDISEEMALERLAPGGADRAIASAFLRAKTAVLKAQIHQFRVG